MPYRLRVLIQIALLRARLRPQYPLAGVGLGLSLVLGVAQPPWVAGWSLVLLSIACHDSARKAFPRAIEAARARPNPLVACGR